MPKILSRNFCVNKNWRLKDARDAKKRRMSSTPDTRTGQEFIRDDDDSRLKNWRSREIPFGDYDAILVNKTAEGLAPQKN